MTATLEFKNSIIANFVIIRMDEKEIWKILSPVYREAKNEMKALRKMFKKKNIPIEKYAGVTNITKMLK